MQNDQQPPHTVALRLLKAACAHINSDRITNTTSANACHTARQYADSIGYLIKKDGMSNAHAAKDMAARAVVELDIIAHQIRAKKTQMNPVAWQNILTAKALLQTTRDSIK